MTQQLALDLAAPTLSESNYRNATVRWLRDWDLIVVNSSAGKDSLAMLDYVMELAGEAGIKDRVVVAHADLGRIEWQGTAELAEEQAKHYGVRFLKVSRPQGDLLAHVRTRRMWPSNTARYCTSDHKRGQVQKIITALTREVAAKLGGSDKVRVLNCLGLRAQESPARAKRLEITHDERNSNTKRDVDTWLPILDWTVEQVWARIRQSGVRHHWAYDLGMPRLSCCFCIFAPKAALVLAGRHNRALLDEYVAVEAEIGHTFRKDLTLAQVKEAVEAGEQGSVNESWCC